MAIDERARHDLHRGLEKVLGPERAATLMAHLSPVPHVALATRDDLRDLERVLVARIEAVGSRIEAAESRIEAKIEREMRAQTRMFFGYAILGNGVTVLGVLALLMTLGRGI